jgi:hypothetical protein
VIGWGEGQSLQAVAQTRAATQNLTEETIKQFAAKGVTREWVASQLAQYQKFIAQGGVKVAKNVQLLPRAELMAKILSLWPK